MDVLKKVLANNALHVICMSFELTHNFIVTTAFRFWFSRFIFRISRPQLLVDRRLHADLRHQRHLRSRIPRASKSSPTSRQKRRQRQQQKTKIRKWFSVPRGNAGWRLVSIDALFSIYLYIYLSIHLICVMFCLSYMLSFTRSYITQKILIWSKQLFGRLPVVRPSPSKFVLIQLRKIHLMRSSNDSKIDVFLFLLYLLSGLSESPPKEETTSAPIPNASKQKTYEPSSFHRHKHMDHVQAIRVSGKKERKKERKKDRQTDRQTERS